MAYTKGFSWSYSKYKNYHTCPKRHYEVDIQRNYTESSEALDWGGEVHTAMAGACRTDLPRIPLKDTMKEYQKWVDRYAHPDAVGDVHVEQKYAMTKDFQPISWRSNNAWFRTVVDFLRVREPVAIMVDWKTGAMKHDSRQLMLSSQVIFAHFPGVRRIHTNFVWFKDDCSTPEDFSRNTIAQEWPPVLAGVKDMEKAAQSMTYPPKPGGLCRQWCPVTSCPFHGKSFR